MKTAPIQQNRVEDAHHSPSDKGSETKSMTPPVFQLKASGEEENKENETQTTPKSLTITNDNALLRSGPPAFESLGKKIPPGTRVEIVEEQGSGKSAYVRVNDLDTGTELGWTWKGNATNLAGDYKQANASYTYHVDGHDLLVFLPKDGLKKTNVDVFMFFHGRGGDYKTSKTHAQNGGYADNPAISGKIPEAVSNSGSIAICPQGHGFKVDQDWGKIQAGGFQKMVNTALSRLSTDLGMTEQPLTAGNVSLAGHSAGGNALGQAALDTGATDVTLQEAGYGFNKSWKKLRDWFMLEQAPKTMRVITQNNSNRNATRKLVQQGASFSSAEIIAYSQQLAEEGKLEGPVTVEETKGDGKVEEGGIVLERCYRVLRSDGSLQGSIRLYHLEDEKADHWDASSQTMEASMTSGAKDRAADQDHMKNR